MNRPVAAIGLLPLQRVPRGWGRRAVVMLVLVVTSAAAGDRVVLQPSDTATPLVLTGDVVDFDADQIELVLNVGQAGRKYPRAEVLHVDTAHTQPHRHGIELYQSNRTEEADRAFSEALSLESRAWVRREILGWKIRCAMRQDDVLAACEHFLAVIESTHNPREWPLIPLEWEAMTANSALLRQARAWLLAEEKVPRLLAASFLLQHPLYGSTARDALGTLAGEGDRHISSLARAQLWRLRVAADDVSENELSQYAREVEALPADVRAGPQYLLGRMYQHRSEFERAAAMFLWLPTVYSENEPLVCRACLEAAVSLEHQGRTADAQTLLKEVVQNYDWSPLSAEARSMLLRLSGSQAR